MAKRGDWTIIPMTSKMHMNTPIRVGLALVASVGLIACNSDSSKDTVASVDGGSDLMKLSSALNFGDCSGSYFNALGGPFLESSADFTPSDILFELASLPLDNSSYWKLNAATGSYVMAVGSFSRSVATTDHRKDITIERLDDTGAVIDEPARMVSNET